MNKYWYEEGMCHALSYKGQWPIIYTSTDGLRYKKKCMACDMISDGHCTLHKNCEVLASAPQEMENTWKLRDKKCNSIKK